MSNPVLSIIIVSYNTREMTLDCLRTVYEETKTPFEVLLVDNNSPDGSAEAVAEAYPQVRLFAETENHGFAGGNNLAAKHAKGEYLLLLNPDTLVLDGGLDKLLAFARRRPEARIWGGRTFFADKSVNRTSCWGRLTLWSLFCRATGLTMALSRSEFFNPESIGEWDRGEEREVDVVTGCFFLISRADWEALNGFDPLFYMYGEEVDLCYRAAAKFGALPRVTPDAEIVHYQGASTTVMARKMVWQLKCRVELIRRHLPRWQHRPAFFLLSLWPAGRALTLKLARRDGPWIEAWARRKEWAGGFAGKKL